MKMNKTKIIVPTLALAMGAALAGSVSGTVAWFQYSTRAQATFIGSSVHCSELLEVRANSGDFGTELSKVAPAANTGDKLEPISTGPMAKNASLPSLYKNPIYQYNDSAKWGAADAHNYLQYTLDFHVLDVNSTTSYLSGHSLYLTDVEIVSLADSSGAATDTTSASKDLYKAVRVHVSSGSYNALFAANGSTGDIVTTTHGALDLNGDGVNDKTQGYDWTSGRSEIDYGLNTTGENPLNTQTAYNASVKDNFADDTTPISLTNDLAAPAKIGTINAAEAGISVTVTIWIEGWTPLMNPAVNYTQAEIDAAQEGDAAYGKTTSDVKIPASESPIWDPATYIGKNFGVGLRFATELHEAHQ